MKHRIVILAWVAAAGCGGAANEASSSGCYGESIELLVTPQSVPRGAAVDIAVQWKVTQTIDEPAEARLVLGEAEEVEVRFPLVLSPLLEGEPPSYGGSLLNPFGAGAPPGDLVVMVRAADGGCATPPSDVTTVALE